MPQKKINSFFIHDNFNSSSSRIPSWNQNNSLQKYHESRKQAKLRQMKEAASIDCDESKNSTQSSQFTHSLEVMDDSLPCSQRTDNGFWSNLNGSYGSNQSRSCAEKSYFNSFGQSQKRREYEQYKEVVKQEQRERHEGEMLKNFLTCAKQCYEDTNEVAKKIYEKLDSSTSETVNLMITKMKECIETSMPELLQSIKDNTNERDNVIQKKLNEMKSKLEKIEAHEESCCDKCLNQLQSNHLEAQEILREIKVFLSKPKPTYSEMSCQYSPQFLNKPLVYDIACQYSPQLEETVDRSKKDRSFKFQDSTNLIIKNKENISETPKSMNYKGHHSLAVISKQVTTPTSQSDIFSDSTNSTYSFQSKTPLGRNKNYFLSPLENNISNLSSSKKYVAGGKTYSTTKVKRTPKKNFASTASSAKKKKKNSSWLFDDDDVTDKLPKTKKKERKMTETTIRTGQSGSVMKQYKPQKKNWNFGSSKKGHIGPHYFPKKSPACKKSGNLPWIIDQLSNSDESDSTYDFSEDF